MGYFRRRREDLEDLAMDQIVSNMEKGGKLYRWLFNIALFSLFVPIAVIVVGFVRHYITAELMLGMAIVAILGAGCIMSLYWIRFLENKQNTKISIIFLSLTIFTIVVWVVSAFIVYALYKGLKSGSTSMNYPLMLNLIKAALIISLQFVTANFIARMVLKYKKSYIAVQVVAYASNVFIDVWLTLLVCCLQISATDLAWNGELGLFLVGPTMLTLFILAWIYSIVVNKIVRTTDYKKMSRMVNDMDNVDFEGNIIKTEQKPKTTKAETSVEEKLEKLKQLYQNELITKEEYEKKRNDILSDM